MSESGGRSLVLRAGDSGLVHDRRRPPHLADSPAPPTAEVALFEAAPGRVRARGCPTYPWYSVYASGVCRTLDSTLVALRLSDTDRDSLLLAVRLERMRCGAHPHLGIRAARRSGLDRSLDRRHLAFHYAPNPAFEDAAGDRSHDALEVHLNPHLGLGLPTVNRLELDSPARRGSAHRSGERQAAGRLDRGHVLGSVASGPEYHLRPLLHPRAGPKRSPTANPAFTNRWRPLRPASDVTDVRPHSRDAACDCYAALGSDRHRAYFVLITFRSRKVVGEATS
jgi:hypothetical protein